MNATHQHYTLSAWRAGLFGAGLHVGLLISGVTPVSAQSVSAPVVFGSVGNFDVSNNQQQDAHGFEVEFIGVQATDVTETFGLERYNSPTVLSTASGVIVRWASAYNAATRKFVATTKPHVAGAPLAHACYQWIDAVAYDASGCEHFGVTLARNATRTQYRWLVADPAHPGALIPGKVSLPVVTPNYSVAAIAAQAVLNADITAPVPSTSPTQYGVAQWMRVYKRQLPRTVLLHELVNTNTAIVPHKAADVEVSWKLVQADPLVQFKPKTSHARTRNTASLAAGTLSVVRRYELYAYTGKYDAAFHQAICSDFPKCVAPAAGEVGALISAQMTAANMTPGSTGQPPIQSKQVTLAVGISRIGVVVSAPSGIACPGNCSAKFDPGTQVTVTAAPPFGGSFVAWGGACTGTQLTCTITVTNDTTVQATFSR
jgi:hypothetical protein